MRFRALWGALLLLLTGCSRVLPEETVQPTPSPCPESTVSGELEAVFLEVGKGDAVLLRLDDATLLIDTGTEAAAPRLLGDLLALGVRRLDAVVLTHSHDDHTGGLPALAENLEIDRFYCASIGETDKKGRLKTQKAIEEAGGSAILLSAGDSIPLGDSCLEVLAPLTFNGKGDNDNSLVLLLAYGGKRWLFTGDMQFAEEQTLLSAGVELSADVLKVGNHGNPDATSDAFASAVSPEWAVFTTDTRVDTDSANSRVRNALGSSKQLLTQDTLCGWRLTQTNGELTADNPSVPDMPPPEVELVPDVKQQRLTLTAREDTDLSGCMVQAVEKGSLFVFPAGTVLSAGETITLSGSEGGGDFRFTAKKPFKAKGDTARLLGIYGR